MYKIKKGAMLRGFKNVQGLNVLIHEHSLVDMKFRKNELTSIDTQGGNSFHIFNKSDSTYIIKSNEVISN